MSFQPNRIGPGVSPDGIVPVVPWTPDQITTAGWYDASDSNTITESGGLVSQWDDKKSGGINFTQLTGANQPTTNSRTINSLNVLDFDGTNDQMIKDAPDLTDGAFILALYEPDSDNTYGLLGYNTNHYDLNSNGGSYPSIFRNTRLENLPLGIQSTGVQLLGYNALSTGPNYDIHYNGEKVYAGTSAFVFQGTGGRRIGISNSAGIRYDGTIAEIIMIDAYTSQSDIEKCEGYLAHKWGVTSILPPGHPYKTEAPTV